MCQKIEEELIKKVVGRLEEKFLGGVVEVDGGDLVHMGVVVKSDLFAGMGLVDQHKMVMSALKDLLNTEELHSIKIKTKAL